ncbi:MAG: transcriptional repressor [Sulfurimonas sp.]
MRLYDLQKCIDERKANNSQAREVIFRVLLETNDCLDAMEILAAAKEIYPRKISLNTVYRHLNFFVECGLAIALKNESKKTYYCLLERNKNLFAMCPKCGFIEKINKEQEGLAGIIEQYDDADYITIHKKCKKCLC